MRRLFITILAALAVTVVSATAHADDYVLALSWEPAFCAIKASDGHVDDRPECSQINGTYSTANLILHGLWPQPESNSYCDVPASVSQFDKPGLWDKLPPVPYTDPSTPKQLLAYMPGIQSYLDRHEWTKHGTCSKQTPDAYFTKATDLLKQMNGSRTGTLISANAGGAITSSQLCSALVADFGGKVLNSATLKVTKVGRESVLSELWLYISDDDQGNLKLGPHNLTGTGGRVRCTDQPIRLLSPSQT